MGIYPSDTLGVGRNEEGILLSFLLIYLAQVTVTLIMFVRTSYLDIRNREVELKEWIPYLSLLLFLPFDIGRVSIALYLYSVVSAVVLVFALYMVGMIGGADLIAIALVSLGNSYVKPLLFPLLSERGAESLTVMLYTSLLIAVVTLYTVVKNLGSAGDLPPEVRWKLVISGKRMRVRDFLQSKFMFPLTVVDEDGRVKYRSTFDIAEDDREWREKYRRLVNEGKIAEDSEIWVTWGIPVLPFMGLGYLLSLILGIPI